MLMMAMVITPQENESICFADTDDDNDGWTDTDEVRQGTLTQVEQQSTH